MSDVHDQLGPFLDGELSSDEALAFEKHLAVCAQCQRDLIDFQALDAAARRGMRRTPARRVAPFVLALAAAALLSFVGWRLMEAPVEQAPQLTLAPSRSIEARLSWPLADGHRPIDALRGEVRAEAIPAAVLAHYERTGDQRALASAWLLSGNVARAKELLAAQASSADVESDLAAIALLERDAEAALAHAENALEVAPTHPQARWNRALALEALGLTLLSSKTFRALEKDDVPGWTSEAGQRAAVLERGWSENLAKTQAALEAAAVMVLQGVPMGDELVRQVPSFARMNFRYALLTAPGEAEVRALVPTAHALDALFGGDLCVRSLERLAKLDPAHRKRFAPRLRRLVTDYYRSLAIGPKVGAELPGLGDATAFVAEVKQAGAREYLLFAAPMGGQLGVVWDDYVAAVKADGDVWFELAIELELARRAGAANDAAGQERRLLEVLERARAVNAVFRVLQVLEQLTTLYASQHRLLEAAEYGREALRLARAQGDQSAALRVLHSLGNAARLRNAKALCVATFEEITLRNPDDCDTRTYLQELIASMEINALNPAAARSALDAAPRCEGSTLSVVGVNVLADLMRLAPQPGDASRLANVLATLRAGELEPLDALALDHLEGRALLDGSPEKGRVLLQDCIRRSRVVATSSADAPKLRAYSYGLLRVAEGEAGRWTEVLSLLESPAPTRCALVVEVQDNRVVAALRSASGSDRGVAKRFAFGARRPDGLGVADIASVVTPLVREGAVGCEKVQVFAGYPLHGRAAWLPDELAWSYAGGGGSDRVGSGPGLVVHDVATPAALKLSRIARWSDAPRPGDLELSGDAATPSRVELAMKSASFIELHVHGQVNPVDADTAALLLAPDERGRHALSAGDLKTRLEGSPVVVLAACRASSVAPFLHEPWSLPRAFLRAGAHAVLAAPVDLPDAEARAFFVKVVERLRSGQDPAIALRDERLQFLKDHPGATWIRSVLVFE